MISKAPKSWKSTWNADASHGDWNFDYAERNGELARPSEVRQLDRMRPPLCGQGSNPFRHANHSLRWNGIAHLGARNFRDGAISVGKPGAEIIVAALFAQILCGRQQRAAHRVRRQIALVL